MLGSGARGQRRPAGARRCRHDGRSITGRTILLGRAPTIGSYAWELKNRDANGSIVRWSAEPVAAPPPDLEQALEILRFQRAGRNCRGGAGNIAKDHHQL